MTSSAAVPDEALLRCADEPIAIPGAIQPHGVLLAVTEPDLTVVIASENAAELFGYQVTGLPLLDLGSIIPLVGSVAELPVAGRDAGT